MAVPVVVKALGGDTNGAGSMAPNRDKLWQSISIAESSGKLTITGLAAAAGVGAGVDSGVEVSVLSAAGGVGGWEGELLPGVQGLSLLLLVL